MDDYTIYDRLADLRRRANRRLSELERRITVVERKMREAGLL